MYNMPSIATDFQEVRKLLDSSSMVAQIRFIFDSMLKTHRLEQLQYHTYVFSCIRLSLSALRAMFGCSNIGSTSQNTFFICCTWSITIFSWNRTAFRLARYWWSDRWAGLNKTILVINATGIPEHTPSIRSTWRDTASAGDSAALFLA